MNDPHVVHLTYHLQQDDTIEYHAPALLVGIQDFQGELSDGTLTLRPLVHFAAEDEAKAAADPIIRAWQVEAGLQHGRDDFRFTFAGSQILDRAAPPGAPSLHFSSTLRLKADAHLKVARSVFPPPPTSFQVTPEVDVLWERYNRWVERREPLLSMAYFCLTILERGDRRDAARRYNIHVDVLRKLGELTSNRGDVLSARKAAGTTALLSGSETVWIEVTLKAIIRHLAERRPNQLTLSDLPTI